MIKLLAIHPADFDGTSYYRAFGVFPNLVKQMGGQLQVDKYHGDRGMKYNWSDLMDYDILFLQRPCLDASKRMMIINYFKDMGKKVWIDFDDNLFDLPLENRMHEDVTPKIKQEMITVLKLADVVTVSTKALQEFFATLGVVAEVVPNALNEEMTPMAESYNLMSIDSKPEQVLWRGSETHQGDLFYHGNQILPAIDERKNTHWHWMGYNPWFITNDLSPDKYSFHKADDIMFYFKNLRKLRPQLIHFPLVPNSLNFCKSNIAWLEATSVGAVIIAPDWAEWKKPGVINYTSIENYGELLLGPAHAVNGWANEDQWQLSRDYIMENLTLENVNKQRVDIVNRLTYPVIRIDTLSKALGHDLMDNLTKLPNTMIE